MTAHNRPGDFLQALMRRLDGDGHPELRDSLVKAERDGKCLRRAVFLTMLLFMLSVTGAGYCAVLLPGVFQDSAHPVMRSLWVLGLASVISQSVFLGCLYQHHRLVKRLHKECRGLVLGLAQSPSKAPIAPEAPAPSTDRSQA